MMDAVVGFTKEDGTTECVRDTVCCMIAGAKPALLGRLGMLGALRTSVCVCAPDLTTACGAPVLQVRNATNSQRATRIGRWVVAGSIGCWGEARPMHGVVACASWSCRHSRRFCLLIPPRPCVTARHLPHLPHTPRAPRKYSTFSHGQTAEIPQNTLIPGFNLGSP